MRRSRASSSGVGVGSGVGVAAGVGVAVGVGVGAWPAAVVARTRNTADAAKRVRGSRLTRATMV